MNQTEINISPEDFVSKLNEGGWMLVGGREVSRPFLASSVIGATLVESELHIETALGKIVAPATIIVRTSPWKICVRQEYEAHQQKKKGEGGGQRTVRIIGSALQIAHLKTQQEFHLKKVAEREREQFIRAAEWQKEQEAAERKTLDERETRRDNFEKNLNTTFVGKTVEKIEVIGNKVLVLLSDRTSLTISNKNSERVYGSSLTIVNGIELKDFRSVS